MDSRLVRADSLKPSMDTENSGDGDVEFLAAVQNG